MRTPRSPEKAARLPRKRPRQSRSEVTVEAILDAAARIFTEAGFDRASTNAIAERAGVSVGSLYQYFPNKLSLLAGLRERHLRRHARRLCAACERCGGMPLPEAIRELVEDTAECFVEQGSLTRLYHHELPHPDGDEPARVAVRAAREAVHALLAAHRAELRVADLNDAALFVCTMASSVMKAAACDRPDQLRNGRIADELATALLHHLTGAADAAGRPGPLDLSERAAR